MSDDLPVLEELQRHLVAGLYDGNSMAGRVRSSGWRRLRLAVALAPGVIVAAAVVVAFLVVGRADQSSAARAFDRAASAASAASVPLLGPEQYWYTRTIETSVAPYPLISSSSGPPAGRLPSTVPVVFRRSMETWIGADGTLRQRQVTLSVSFPTAAAQRLWRRSGAHYPSFGSNDSITVGGGRFPPQGGAVGGDVGDGLFTYQQLRALPTTAAHLQATLARAQTALQRRERQGFSETRPAPGTTSKTITLRGHPVAHARSNSMLMTIASLLTTPVTPAVRAALYRVAATLPGVVYRGEVRDALGRSGVEIEVGSGPGGWRMIFDPTTGDLLQTSLTFAGAAFGDLTDTVAAQGVADSIYALPAGFPSSPGRLPAPPTLAITPRTGTVTTVFSMQLPAPSGAAPRTHAPSQFVTVNGPTGRGCAKYLLPPPTAVLRNGTVARAVGGGYAYQYSLAPTATGRDAWCPGHYELQLGAQDQTAAYFTVR